MTLPSSAIWHNSCISATCFPKDDLEKDGNSQQDKSMHRSGRILITQSKDVEIDIAKKNWYKLQLRKQFLTSRSVTSTSAISIDNNRERFKEEVSSERVSILFITLVERRKAAMIPSKFHESPCNRRKQIQKENSMADNRQQFAESYGDITCNCTPLIWHMNMNTFTIFSTSPFVGGIGRNKFYFLFFKVTILAAGAAVSCTICLQFLCVHNENTILRYDFLVRIRKYSMIRCQDLKGWPISMEDKAKFIIVTSLIKENWEKHWTITVTDCRSLLIANASTVYKRTTLWLAS